MKNTNNYTSFPGSIIYDLKDTHGLPIDLSFLMCKEHNKTPNIAELLCTAWLKNCLGFDSICNELISLGYIEAIHKWKELGVWFLSKHPKADKQLNPIDVYCKWLLQKIYIKRRQ